MKKIFRLSIFSTFAFLSLASFSHGIIVEVPEQQGQEDIAIEGMTRIQSDESNVFKTIQIINKYLWFSISVICMWVLVFGGFKLITAQGDEKKMQEANKLLMGAWIGIAISLLSYALVRIITNLL